MQRTQDFNVMRGMLFERNNVMKTIRAVGYLLQVINSSSNFFVYKYLEWKEKKALKKGKNTNPGANVDTNTGADLIAKTSV